MNSAIHASRIKSFRKEKWFKLVICLLLDILGNGSFLLPAFGEFTDIPFALVSGFILSLMFTKYGKSRSITLGAINTIEELVPFTDFIPTATFTWFTIFVRNEFQSFEYFIERQDKIREIASR